MMSAKDQREIALICYYDQGKRKQIEISWIKKRATSIIERENVNLKILFLTMRKQENE